MAEAMHAFCLIILITAATSVGVCGYGDKQTLSFDKFQWKQPSSVRTGCSSPISRRQNSSTILEMKHGDFCSGPITDWNSRLQKRITFDNNRVWSIQSRIRNMGLGTTQDASQTEIPLSSGAKLQTLNYIVTIGIGRRNMTVIVDTGSDLTWVQCQPCNSCYTQAESLFNPQLSPSYQSVQCNSPGCQTLQFATGNSGLCQGDPPKCNYLVSYGDGSYSRGELASDRLMLGTTPVDGFLFGCGRNNKGLFGGASGLMGLGRSELSLISQTTDAFGGVFSYCLPSTTNEASGSLILGGDSSVYKITTPLIYTRMLRDPALPFYFLNLTGISIGGVALQDETFGNGRILIDSGTVITRLPPSAYQAVKTEFTKQFSGYPSAPGFSILDTCFDLSTYDQVNVPTIGMQFEGDTELVVDVTGVLYFVKTDASQVCLAIASLPFEEETAIIGNYQQRNTRVVYDTKTSKVGFAKESCNSM